LKYLGERSYAIYLWHWPVCLLTRPGLDVPITGWANAGLRIGIAVVLAEISYQLIEKSIRRYGFLAPLRRNKSDRPPRPGSMDTRRRPVPTRGWSRAVRGHSSSVPPCSPSR
jgi:peptidoglycan/LPS O-acetylase OafA/YrhL